MTKFVIYGVILLILGLFLRLFWISSRPMPPMNGERITLKTNDNVNLVGTYYQATGTTGVLLLHMMPATKESWESFATKLQSAGFNVLAIDLRGHGESDGGANGYKNFSDADHQASIHDVEAAVEFLKSKKVSQISIAGASIGANLALWYMADHPDIKKGILLSAGYNYHGVVTEPYAAALKTDQAVYFVGNEDDMRSSGHSAADMARGLYEKTNAKKVIKIFKGAGHGTDIFISHLELEDELVQWLK